MRIPPHVLALVAVGCSNQSPQAPVAPPEEKAEIAISAPADEAPPALERLWLAKGFSSPEGVAPAPDGAYFISNVGGEDIDGDGYVSKLGPDGTVTAARFIDGLDGPKGMAVSNGVLYVTDIVRVRTFDAATGAAGAVTEIPGARFLNDATVWRGEIYVSDSGTGRIWRLSSEGPVIWREDDELSGVNGLLGVDERMLVSTMSSGSLFEATAEGGWTMIASGMIDADGIGIVPEASGGGYLVSSWPGEVHHVAPDGKVTSVLNTRDAGILQNDLTTFGDTVIIPNWEPGTVTAWKIVR